MPTIAAVVRCEYSMMAWMSLKGGIQLPWQVGHSGQPSPEPVERTTTPTMTSTKVIATVAAASRVKRVKHSSDALDHGPMQWSVERAGP